MMKSSHEFFRFPSGTPQQEFRGETLSPLGEINRHRIILYDVMHILVLASEFS